MLHKSLKLEMLEAFAIYNAKNGEFREQEWQKYVIAREAYLKALSIENGAKYFPLKDLLVKLEH